MLKYICKHKKIGDNTMVQKMILSEGFDGDRHVMSYEEAKQEIYDIASTGMWSRVC